MSFFDTLNDKFFNPFCCRNRAVYFECITQLIEKSKEIRKRFIIGRIVRLQLL